MPGGVGRNQPFSVLAKPAGPRCNLACEYCFYLEKERLYPEQPPASMSDAVLESLTRQYLDAHPGQVVSFVWQGGEPTLLGIEFFERAIGIQRALAGGRPVENAIQTNGVLLDDRWGEFLARHDFLVGLSIDGPRGLHDRYRRDRGAAPTFDRVTRGVECLAKHGVRFNTLTTVHRGNAGRPLDVYRFLKSIGSRYMQFIPIVERVAGAPDGAGRHLVAPGESARGRVSPWSVEPRQYGEFLCAVFDEWVRQDVASCFVQAFDVALEAWCGLPASVCVFAETCGRAVAVEHNGDVYSCDHYVYPGHRIGNLVDEPLRELVDGPVQAGFGLDKRDGLPADCVRCEVRFACHGECPKHRFARAGDGSATLNYLCPAYKRFFRHIDPYMRFMANELANERPPANVMRWVADGDMATAMKRANRNAPCPCGSGRKFKRCHGLEVDSRQ